MSGSKLVQLADPGTVLSVLSVCWELSGSDAKSVCQMFGRGMELPWSASRLMLNPRQGQAVHMSGLRQYILYLLVGSK